jgi:hypothetical protein
VRIAKGRPKGRPFCLVPHRVPDAVQRLFDGAPQSRDRIKRRRL